MARYTFHARPTEIVVLIQYDVERPEGLIFFIEPKNRSHRLALRPPGVLEKQCVGVNAGIIEQFPAADELMSEQFEKNLAQSHPFECSVTLFIRAKAAQAAQAAEAEAEAEAEAAPGAASPG